MPGPSVLAPEQVADQVFPRFVPVLWVRGPAHMNPKLTTGPRPAALCDVLGVMWTLDVQVRRGAQDIAVRVTYSTDLVQGEIVAERSSRGWNFGHTTSSSAGTLPSKPGNITHAKRRSTKQSAFGRTG